MNFDEEISSLIAEIEKVLLTDYSVVNVQKQRQVLAKVHQYFISKLSKSPTLTDFEEKLAKTIVNAVSLNLQNQEATLHQKKESLLQEIKELEQQKELIMAQFLETVINRCSEALEEKINLLWETKQALKSQLSELPKIIQEPHFQGLTNLPEIANKEVAQVTPTTIRSLSELFETTVNYSVNSSSGWYLGLDFGSSAIAAVLLNAQSGDQYPIFWSLKNGETFRLPTYAWAVTPNSPFVVGASLEEIDQQNGFFLDNFKPYLELGIASHQVGKNTSNSDNLPSLYSFLQATRAILSTLNPSYTGSIGALGLSAKAVREILSSLQGVVVSCSAHWSDTYRFNLREALLKTELVTQAEQVFFLEEAIAAVLASTNMASGLTLIINSGACTTELALVDLPANLNYLTYNDFTCESFAYAGNAFEQDILFELIYPQLKELHPYLFKLEQERPQLGEIEAPKRHYLNVLLQSYAIGRSLLEAARLVKLILQHQDEFVSQLGNHQWSVQRQNLELVIIPYFLKQLDLHLNILLAKTGTSPSAITQILCTGSTTMAMNNTLSQWLQEKFSQAKLLQDTEEENLLRVATGLARLPIFPEVLNLPRHQYSDYFLLLELLDTIKDRDYTIEDIMSLLAKRGINTRVCYQRLISLINGELPTGLVSDNSTISNIFAAKAQQQPLLFQNEGMYTPNWEICQSLRQYLSNVLSFTKQNMSDPLIVNFHEL